MATLSIVRCDKCGKQVDDKKDARVIVLEWGPKNQPTGGYYSAKTRKGVKMDTCVSCASELVPFVRDLAGDKAADEFAAYVTPPPKATPKPKSPVKK